MFRRSASVIFVVALVALFVGLALPAAADNPNYATCIQCHPLPIDQAKGLLGSHPAPVGVMVFPPPPPETVCAGCHSPLPHYGPAILPNYKYYWQWPTDPLSYPTGPSVITQMCEDCHNGVQAPAPHQSGNSHPYDSIPYGQSTTTPTSILPLYTGAGVPSQVYNSGGLVCSTCHDPHDPSYTINGNAPFLRIGVTGDSTLLCTFCHRDATDSPPSDYELVIPDLVGGISMGPSATTPGTYNFNLTIRNRGNAEYPGNNDYPVNPLAITLRAEDASGTIYEIGSYPIVPRILPDMQMPIPIPWDSAGWSGEVVFHFILPGSSLNPERTYEFVKSFNVNVPAPTNLQVTLTTSSTVSLSWNPPQNVAGTLNYYVYRNGQKTTASAFSTTSFTDVDLPPETPVTYTVQAVDSLGKPSPMSNRVGAETQAGEIRLVPSAQYASISAAIATAGPGTSIHVAPGRYGDWINLAGKDRITIRGQDANACILESATAISVNMDPLIGANTLRGFTIRNGLIQSGTRDTIAQCVIVNTNAAPSVIYGGGFLANCVIDNNSPASITIQSTNFLMAANSVIRTAATNPFAFFSSSPATAIYLLNNDILPSGTWTTYPGERNFSADPLFIGSGSYYLLSNSSCINSGAAVGLPFNGASPDIGALEYGLVYSPLPPVNLTATWNLAAQNGELAWLPPPPSAPPATLNMEWRIYRSSSQSFPYDAPAYATLPASSLSYIDTNVPKGQTWYYQVRYAGYDTQAGWLLSAPSSTVSYFANRPPQAVDDTASVNWYTSNAIYALANDSDPDGDPLTVGSYTNPANGTIALVPPPPLPAPQTSYFWYTPASGYFGTDSFTYTINDAHGATATATVSITVNKVNRKPVAIADTAVTKAFTLVNIAVLDNDSDPDGDPISVSWVSTPAYGTAAINADNKTVRYTPTGANVGMDTFQYTVIDGKGGSTLAQVTVTIEPIKFTSSIFIKTTTSGDYTIATAIVTVLDEFGALLPGVSVSGHWSGLTADSDSGTTGSSGNMLGKVYLDSNSVRRARGTFTFTIDSAVKSGYTFNTAGSVTTKSVLYPPGAGLMHVQSIDFVVNTAKRTVTAKVLVLNDIGVPVAGAQVAVAWTGAATGSTSATTASTGYATLNAPSLRNASGQTLVCTVSGITKLGWTYDAGANLETSDSTVAP